ncbi:selenocysteine synthase [Actinobacillus minor NM305]|uniref:Selenocysteine synthase n=1 Tax=Actinobacillus minor NM305 TaxID=637911 RepID=C5S2M4_9PAST|nr:ATP-binding protein [Actinobacillus minor]EER46799.1 selenocysteine synthase [Actinobacillus minor NM305]MDY5106558.1 ATP-binding protein [Actinobacillus minor]
MKRTDPLYFPRSELAQRLLTSLKDGITHALTLFAPRRMGKTQFLLNDIEPKAEEMGFNVFYFSFMEQADDNKTQQAFVYALLDFLNKITQGKSKLIDTLKSIKSLDILGVGVELNEQEEQAQINVSRLLNEIAEKSEKPILMLLDEVQELARSKGNDGLIRSLRTGLDVNQSKIKVIFTGSSTNGLKAMFNDNKAPFFHFAHALNFPHLDKSFTDFLADIYEQRTGKQLDKTAFYQTFERFHFTPLYMRAITQDMIINPDLTLDEVVEYRLSQMDEQGGIMKQWQHLSELERQLLRLIANGNSTPYSKETRLMLAEVMGIEDITSSTIQGKLRKLERNELITRNIDKTLQINNPHFKTWIKERIQDE